MPTCSDITDVFDAIYKSDVNPELIYTPVAETWAVLLQIAVQFVLNMKQQMNIMVAVSENHGYICF